jgi:transposase
MSETPAITTERVDDIPLLLQQMKRLDLPQLLDAHFVCHGNWQGLSLGWVATIWLAHILSEADHRLNQVQPWAEHRLTTLRACTRRPVQPLDLTDDRLAQVLRTLSDDAEWTTFERALTRTVLRVYDLRPAQVRVDSTTASGYWQVSEDGLFQFGHSKDHRPDLPQLKVLLATLDPLGLPVATDVLSGERADDPLYLPAIQRVRTTLGQRGLLYIGDCKMASLATRAGVQAGGDYYLCPLPAVQVPPETLATYLAGVQDGTQPVQAIHREQADGTQEQLADGFEVSVTLTAEHDGWPVTWTERRLVVRSLAQARTAAQALRARLARAQAALADLTVRRRGKRRLPDQAAVEQAAAAILAHYQVADLLAVTCTEQVQERRVRGYRGQPARVQPERAVRLTVTVNEAALTDAIQCLGWRVYGTNQPAAQLSLAQAVLAYREEYLIERGLGRLKGRPLSLRPLYLAREDHATGLVRLLTIGLRVLTLLEFAVRRRLAAEGGAVAGLYAGQPTRTTTRPTAERLLANFRNITLTLVHLPGHLLRHVTPLTPLQERILTLLDLTPVIYLRLVTDSDQPP